MPQPVSLRLPTADVKNIVHVQLSDTPEQQFAVSKDGDLLVTSVETTDTFCADDYFPDDRRHDKDRPEASSPFSARNLTNPPLPRPRYYPLSFRKRLQRKPKGRKNNKNKTPTHRPRCFNSLKIEGQSSRPGIRIIRGYEAELVARALGLPFPERYGRGAFGHMKCARAAIGDDASRPAPVNATRPGAADNAERVHIAYVAVNVLRLAA